MAFLQTIRTAYVLAEADIHSKFARTRLSVAWYCVTHCIWITAAHTLFYSTSDKPLSESLPYISIGLAVWNVIAYSLTGGASAFLGYRSLANAIRMPQLALPLHAAMVTFFIFGLHFLISVIIALALGVSGKVHYIYFLAFLPLMFITSLSVMILIGIIAARFRDIRHMIDNVVMIGFILTPVFWHSELMNKNTWLLNVNPAYHYVEVARSAWLGTGASLDSWIYVGAFTTAVASAAAVAYGLFAKRLYVWSI